MTSDDRKGMAEERKGIAEERKGIAEERKGIAEERKGIAEERKGIARGPKRDGRENVLASLWSQLCLQTKEIETVLVNRRKIINGRLL